MNFVFKMSPRLLLSHRNFWTLSSGDALSTHFGGDIAWKCAEFAGF